MNQRKFLLLLLFLNGIILSSNAFYKIEKKQNTNGGVGYDDVSECHSTVYLQNGTTMCLASLNCSGNGWSACSWIVPLTQCEKDGNIVVNTHGGTGAGTAEEEYNYVSAVVEEAIAAGSTSGRIQIGEAKLIVYSGIDDGFELYVYSKDEAIALGLWTN